MISFSNCSYAIPKKYCLSKFQRCLLFLKQQTLLLLVKTVVFDLKFIHLYKKFYIKLYKDGRTAFKFSTTISESLLTYLRRPYLI